MNHCGGLLPDRASSPLSHFLTMNADPYMNGGVQGPSAIEDLACTPKASHRGIQGKGKVTSGEVCRAAALQGAIGQRHATARRSDSQEEAWPAVQTRSPWAVPPNTASGR